MIFEPPLCKCRSCVPHPPLHEPAHRPARSAMERVEVLFRVLRMSIEMETRAEGLVRRPSRYAQTNILIIPWKIMTSTDESDVGVLSRGTDTSFLEHEALPGGPGSRCGSPLSRFHWSTAPETSQEPCSNIRRTIHLRRHKTWS